MSSDDIVISVENVSKAYRIWEVPSARLKAPFLNAAARLFPLGSAIRRGLESKAQNYYRDFYALRDVSFQIRKGESIGIIGRNGSGKSTLLQIIAGTLQPTSGSVHVRGRVAALLELGSGFNPDFSGRENVYLNAAVLGFTRRETDARFDSISAFADIGEFIDQPVKTYSSGMVVRLAFAVQTSVEPDILIIDEALSVGDEAFQRKCFARIETLKRGGTTLLFVSHSAVLVIELCSHALLLSAGAIETDGQPKSVVTRYHQQLYGGPCQPTPETAPPVYTNTEGAKPPSWDISVRNSLPSDGSFMGAGLASPETTIYPDAGAIIRTPRIVNHEGNVVNHLSRGQTYWYTYEIEVTAYLKGVRFGGVIKTVTGMEFGGMASHRNTERIPEVSPGERFSVRFEFVCRLLPGIYFMNAGALAISGTGEEYFATRLVDAVLFRVLYEPDLPVNGLVDLLNHVSIAHLDR